ncbi:hypothetical protein CFN78_00515 [Amycolatopsis antarctica]|uniref:Uncharacterized protein n=1 Tax=Amycolatopsis antarctica TaxID=1854586 RepID=A0A263DB84_9PSEU|nr:hypothetical protein [Amycolatopsis antarctica]OZM74756.1 hypothetical protein CFN78_00515 [Amycolatopsis antarctica]
MTATEDRTIADRLTLMRPGPPPIHTRAEIRALLRTWARENPPRRFALYETGSDENGWDGTVFAWGLGFDTHLVVRSIDERVHGRFSSAETMLSVLGRRFDLGMVWIDEEP